MKLKIKIKGEVDDQSSLEFYNLRLALSDIPNKKIALELREKLQNALGQLELELESQPPLGQ